MNRGWKQMSAVSGCLEAFLSPGELHSRVFFFFFFFGLHFHFGLDIFILDGNDDAASRFYSPLPLHGRVREGLREISSYGTRGNVVLKVSLG